MDIDVRLEQVAVLLADNLTGLHAARAAYEAVVNAIAGSGSAVRIARSLADLDRHAVALDEQNTRLAAVGREQCLTADEVRAIRRKCRVEEQRAATRRALAPTRPNHLQAVSGWG